MEEKDDYDYDTYQYIDQQIWRYIFIGDNISGTQYDVARVQWGGNWRMPTLLECQELIEKCSWEWMAYKGVNGMMVTGPNGNSIFLPSAGHRDLENINYQGEGGTYWTGTHNSMGWSCYLGFNSGGVHCGNDSFRYGGYTIRPVSD